MSEIERGFVTDPDKYCQQYRDLRLWEMHKKWWQFAEIFARTPEVNEDITPNKARAIDSILNLFKDEDIPKDYMDSPDDGIHKIILEWGGDDKGNWRGQLLNVGNKNGIYAIRFLPMAKLLMLIQLDLNLAKTTCIKSCLLKRANLDGIQLLARETRMA